MADRSAIEWTDATVNFWWGCTKVGPGCDHCYAETWAKRTGGSHWGNGVPRRKIAGAPALIHRLDNGYSDWAADAECMRGNAKAFGLPIPTIGNRRRVFIQSMSDLFDLEVPTEWFAEAWDLIKSCNRIEIQIVTKRLPAIEKRLAEIGETSWPKHAGLIVSIVNRAEADRDLSRLRELKARLSIPWVGISFEPLLGPIIADLSEIDWAIVGGESGRGARPMRPDWARSLRDQCASTGVPFLFKQWGEYLPVGQHLPGHGKIHGATAVKPGRMKLHYGGTPDRHPDHAFAERGVEFASTADNRLTFRVGKKAAGRLLDGELHNAMPKVAR
jgi:protein gp37